MYATMFAIASRVLLKAELWAYVGADNRRSGVLWVQIMLTNKKKHVYSSTILFVFLFLYQKDYNNQKSVVHCRHVYPQAE